MLVKFIYTAWLASIVLQFALAGVLLAKKTWRAFPAFTAYALFGLLQGVLGYSIRGNLHLYLHVYAFCETLSCILGLGVIYEVYTRLLTHYPALHKAASTAFPTATALLLLASLAVAYFHAPVQGEKFVAGFIVLEQATRVTEVGLLIFLFSFSHVFGLHWRQSIFGMALGLGLFTAIELTGITVRAYLGPGAASAFAITRGLSFNASVLIWIGYLLLPERVTTAEMPQRAQLEQWNQAIMELIHQ